MSDPDLAIETIIDDYCAVWNDPDAARRREMLVRVLADGATYTDPTVHAVGIDELLAHIGKVVARRPGASVVRTSRVDVHHQVARFAWRLVQADGATLPDGVDFVELSADGLIRRIVGFFGPLTKLD